MPCTKEKETFTNICIRKKQTNVKRGRYPVIKNPSRDKVKCGRSNGAKTLGNTPGTQHARASRLVSVLTPLQTLSQMSNAYSPVTTHTRVEPTHTPSSLTRLPSKGQR